MLGQLHLFGQNHFTLLQRALHIDILELITEVDGLLDQSNETPLDLQAHSSALLDPLVEDTAGLDVENLATVEERQ